jgi:hypothetical protein
MYLSITVNSFQYAIDKKGQLLEYYNVFCRQSIKNFNSVTVFQQIDYY